MTTSRLGRIIAGVLSLTCVAQFTLLWDSQVAAEVQSNATSLVSTKLVPAKAPRIVSADSTSGRPKFTIADMSPDTGVYAVQWVQSRDDFNSYQMVRTTSKEITLPDYFACTRSYSFRVFVMADDWLLIDGHQTQNVTSHSQIVSLTMPQCASSAPETTIPVTVSCANGGICAFGDTGPGGGIVFYVASSNFSSTGSDCSTSCRYLETAPAGWGNEITVEDGETSGTTTDDPRLKWCSTNTTLLSVVAAGIGAGMANTTTADSTCTAGAIQASANYVGAGTTDWYLPSQLELNELCKYARQQTTGDTAVVCDNTGSLRVGFSSEDYWASTEGNATQSCAIYFVTPSLGCVRAKSGRTEVRPIRAFG